MRYKNWYQLLGSGTQAVVIHVNYNDQMFVPFARGLLKLTHQKNQNAFDRL